VNGPLLIVAAVPEELAGLAADLRDGRESVLGGRRIMEGRLRGIPVRLLASGPGMANAVHATTVAVESKRPRGILNIGCAGAFTAAGLDVGDAALASAAVDLHLGLEAADGGLLPDPLPFPVLPGTNGEISERPGWYPCHAEWVRGAKEALSSTTDFGFGTGPILTVSTVTTSDEQAAALFQRFRPVMEAMEGAGVAHVAAFYGIPFLELRAAANRVGRRERERWNLPLAFGRCAEAVRRILAADAVPAPNSQFGNA
jgi:futalosine hydrolase